MIHTKIGNKKHKMRVASGPEVPMYMPGWVYFLCDNCDANVGIERPVWYKIVVEGDKRLVDVLGTWRVCRGRTR